MVVQAQNNQTLAEYAKAPKPGQGIRLDRRISMLVWKAFEEYRALMDAEKISNSACAINEYAQLLSAGLGERMVSSVKANPIIYQNSLVALQGGIEGS